MISIVIPCHNEELGINHIYKELTHLLSPMNSYEIIFVDDGSKDKTLNILMSLSINDQHVHYLSFSRNFGHQKAIKAGIDYANGDAVITMDADMQHPPYFILQMIKEWEKGYDIVNAIRKEQAQPSTLKKYSSCLFYKLMNFLSDIPFSGGADFRLYDKSVVNILKSYNEESLFFRGYVAWIGFRQTDLYYEEQKRYAGKSNYTFRKMLNLALEGITSFSIRPLRLSIFLGIICIFITMIYALYVLYIYCFTNSAVPGWTSIILLVSFFGSTQLIVLGIIGEYLGKLFLETKKRPQYIVRKSDKL